MPAKAVSITIDRETRSIKPGAVRGLDIIKLANIAPGEQVFLEVPDDVDIPISDSDILLVRGGEEFSIGDGQPRIQDNPQIRKPVAFTLNDVPAPGTLAKHAKYTGEEIKALADSGELDLWADLDGIADELVADSDMIILQAKDRFFTVLREAEDRFYDVTVILDGEDKQRRFPAMMTVREATRRSLPAKDRPQVNDFDMVDGNIGTVPLNPDISLKDAGVRDGHILSITKKSGGGGWAQ